MPGALLIAECDSIAIALGSSAIAIRIIRRDVRSEFQANTRLNSIDIGSIGDVRRSGASLAQR